MTDLPRIQELSGLIGRIYDCSLDRQRWPLFLEAVARSFGSDQALTVNVDSRPKPGGAMAFLGMDMDVVTKWKDSKEHVDPWYQAIMTQRQHMSYRGTDLCSRRVLHSSAFYADSLRALDIEHTLGGIFVEDEARNWGIAIYRDKRAGRFTREQQALFSLLVPHFGRSIKIGQLLSQRRAQTEAFADALEQSSFGIALLDSFKNVLWTNSKAEKLFLESDGITVRYGSVALWDYRTQKAFDQAAEQAVSVANHQGIETNDALNIPRPSGQPDYHVLICPLNRQSDIEASVDAAAACMVLLHDPAEVRQLSTATMQALYGLSPAEARLCAALFARGSLAEALGSLDISRNTAKTQLAQIFDKVGVSSQAELLQRLALSFR